MPKTRIVIKRDGSVVIEGLGYFGSECLSDLHRILEGLEKSGAKIDIKEVKRKISESQAVAERGVEG